MSTGAPAGSAAQAAARSAAASDMAGASSARRDAWVTGATARRRSRHTSPSEMNRPSPSSGSSAWRICGLLRSSAAASSMNAACTVAGLLQTRIGCASTRVEMFSCANWSAAHTSRKLRRARRSSSGNGSRPVCRGGKGGT